MLVQGRVSKSCRLDDNVLRVAGIESVQFSPGDLQELVKPLLRAVEVATVGATAATGCEVFAYAVRNRQPALRSVLVAAVGAGALARAGITAEQRLGSLHSWRWNEHQLSRERLCVGNDAALRGFVAVVEAGDGNKLETTRGGRCHGARG